MGRSKAPEFKDFWEAYPLHKGKRDAELAWNRLSAGDKQKALAGIARYREYIAQTGMNIKYPQGWLNGRRWEDEYEDPIASFAAKFEGGGHTATKTEQPGAAAPLPSRGGAGVGSVTPPADAIADMETW